MHSDHLISAVTICERDVIFLYDTVELCEDSINGIAIGSQAKTFAIHQQLLSYSIRVLFPYSYFAIRARLVLVCVSEIAPRLDMKRAGKCCLQRKIRKVHGAFLRRATNAVNAAACPHHVN